MGAAHNPRIKDLEKAFLLFPRDMKTMLKSVDSMFRDREKQLFRTEGGSGGRRWPKLAASTLKTKRRLRSGVARARQTTALGADVTGQAGLVVGPVSLKVMQRYGRLRKGLTQRKHGDHVARYELSVFGAWLKLGTKNIVAAYYGAGKKYRPKKIRNVMQMTENTRRKYFRVVSDYMVNKKLARQLKALSAGARALRDTARQRARGK